MGFVSYANKALAIMFSCVFVVLVLVSFNFLFVVQVLLFCKSVCVSFCSLDEQCKLCSVVYFISIKPSFIQKKNLLRNLVLEKIVGGRIRTCAGKAHMISSHAR